MPNSLEANFGKKVFDKDGLKQIIQQEEKAYYLDEVWRLFSLWLSQNGCTLIYKMMDQRNAEYDRYEPATHDDRRLGAREQESGIA